MVSRLSAFVVVVVVICEVGGLAISGRAAVPASSPARSSSPLASQALERLKTTTGRNRAMAMQEFGATLERDPATRDDPAVLAAFAECATDADAAVRREAARTIGELWIWGRQPQNLQAIEIEKRLSRDDDPKVVHYAIYFGLSTVNDKTDEVIRAMFDAAAAAKDYDQINLHGRIAWGLKGTPPARLAALCEPYWAKRNQDESSTKSAWLMYRLYVQTTGQEPPEAERFAALKAEVAAKEAAEKKAAAERVPALAAALREGDSARRMEALRQISTTRFMWDALDDSVLDAMWVAADDPSPRVRAEIARTSGNRWVWSTTEQNPKAIELALKLRKDADPLVRHYAVYFGLSTVTDPSDEVIRALIDSGIVETDGHTTGRAAWRLKRVPADRLAPFVAPYLDKGGKEAARAAKFYTEVTGGPPPRSAASQQTSAAAKSYASAFKELYAHLGRVYPAFEIKNIDWKKVGEELLPKADAVKEDRAFGLLCLELVARLEDSHAQLLPAAAPIPTIDFPTYDPGFACLIDDRDRPVVYHVDEDSPADKAGVKIGMAVISVNGTPATDAMKEWMQRQRTYVGYSSERYLRYDAARGFVRQAKRGEIVKLEMEDLAGAKRQFELPATLNVRYLPRLPVPIDGIDDSGAVEARRLDGDIGYIYVRRIRGELPESIDAALKQLGKINGLIIDVRGNSGGGFDADRALRNFDPEDKQEPDRPRYAGPIALLIDERCISAGEGWSSWFFAKHRARAFGTTTAGASSRKEEYTLSNGLFKVIVPVKAYTGFLDRPIERRGLEPDVAVRVTAADLAAGRDTVLETARQWLREQIEPPK